MQKFLTSKYKGRRFEVINNFATGLDEGLVVSILACTGSDGDGDHFYEVDHPKVQGVMQSWLEDSTIMKEII